jgi:exosortase B
MSSLASPTVALGQRNGRWRAWLPVAAGLLVLYVPTFVGLAHGLWTRDEQLHGPIVVAVLVWLVWQQRGQLVGETEERAQPWTGTAVLLLGLLVYVLGRSQDIILFEVGSLVPVLGGAVLAMRGWRTLWAFKFPLCFVAFMVPLPGVIVDALTGPLKQHVSALAESLLYALGYPIGRTGVVLTVGPYQLLVADACSGLHSLISMSAMGLLYIYLTEHASIVRNAILAVCLLPIAFAANVVRVVALVLVTLYFGDAAGQGFIHDVSGIFLFVVGLLLLFAIDSGLGRGGPRRGPRMEAA